LLRTPKESFGLFALAPFTCFAIVFTSFIAVPHGCG